MSEAAKVLEHALKVCHLEILVGSESKVVDALDSKSDRFLLLPSKNEETNEAKELAVMADAIETCFKAADRQALANSMM